MAEAVQTDPKQRWTRRQWAVRVLTVVLTYLVLEAFLPPAWQPSSYVCVGVIRVYQATLSKVLKSAGAKCRFTPTCSHYGAAAIRKYGTLSGGLRTAGRIFRCAPWGPPPGEDLP